MDTQTITLIVIGIYTLILIAVAAKTALDQDLDGFVIANRKVGIIPTIASISAGFRDVAFFTIWITFSYIYGYGLFTSLIGAIIGYSVLAFIAPKIRQRAITQNYITSGQMIEDGVGPASRKITSIIVLFMSLFFSAAQFFVIGIIISKTIGFPPHYTIGSIAFIIGLYLWTGGYKSVIKTDTIQFFIILTFISLPFFIPVSIEAVLDTSSFGSMGWANTSALALSLFFGCFVKPEMWQRIFSSKSAKSIQISLPVASLFFGFLSFGLVILGIYAKEIMPNTDPNILFYKFFELATLSPFVLAGIILVLFAMAMSTIDTQMYVFTSTVLEDFMHIDTKINRKKYILYSRILMITALIFMAIFALTFDNIVSAMMGFIGVYSVSLPAFILAAYGFIKPSPKLDKAIAGSIIIAFSVFIYMFSKDLFIRSFTYTLIPVGVSITLAVLACGYYVWREKKTSKNTHSY